MDKQDRMYGRYRWYRNGLLLLSFMVIVFAALLPYDDPTASDADHVEPRASLHDHPSALAGLLWVFSCGLCILAGFAHVRSKGQIVSTETKMMSVVNLLFGIIFGIVFAAFYSILAAFVLGFDIAYEMFGI